MHIRYAHRASKSHLLTFAQITLFAHMHKAISLKAEGEFLVDPAIAGAKPESADNAHRPVKVSIKFAK